MPDCGLIEAQLKTSNGRTQILELLKGTIRVLQGTIGTIMKAQKWARLQRFVGKIGTIFMALPLKAQWP